MFVLAALGLTGVVRAQKILIFMDLKQTDHLKAYGVAYWTLEQGIPVEWLLNYRGGSFMMDYNQAVERECRLRGVAYTVVNAADVTQIYATIEANNMEVVRLEKAPKIAVYTPPNKQVWDDAVTLALTYAEIPYTTVWDAEVLSGELDNYDWLHLHHEDFTGQYGKFYASYRNAPWYQEAVAQNEEMARRLGFKKVSELKKAVARAIKQYVVRGGFLFAMCSATDTIDIALAAENTDIVPAVFDGDPPDPDCQSKLDYSKTFAFTNFTVILDPMVYEFSDIDIPPNYAPVLRGPEADYFTLFEFSAKYDPVPTMLTQDHTNVIKGFMGQTTGFRRDKIKKSVVILGAAEGTQQVKYIHGNVGKGTFTFLGGHDPEDYQHYVYDPPTQLSLHKNSPGYRLILNNVLFPAAKKKERKT
ncbi:MAG: asparagine synthetase B [Calditrichaeota bacterium]|nr:asparagine synthetase B [Calditrichota bacterium]